jgi:hypothetical protein
MQRWFSSRSLSRAGEPAEGGRARSAQESGAAEERDPGEGAGAARTGEPRQVDAKQGSGNRRPPEKGGGRDRAESEMVSASCMERT